MATDDAPQSATSDRLTVFRQALAAERPPLTEWRRILEMHRMATGDAPLVDRDGLGDLADPRSYVFPIGKSVLDAWHAPEVADGVLEYFVERFPHQAEVARVRVNGDYAVSVKVLPRDAPPAAGAAESTGPAVVVPVAGRLSFEDQATLTERLFAEVRAARDRGGCVIVDLSEWLYSDTGFPRPVLRALKQAMAAPAVPLVLVMPRSPASRGRIDLWQLHKVMPCHETLDDAETALGIRKAPPTPGGRNIDYTQPGWFDRLFDAVKAENARALVDARQAAVESGKEPFSLARIEQLMRRSLIERAASLEMSYYVGHPEIRTLEEFAELQRVLDAWD